MLKSFQRYGRVFFAGFLVMLSFAGGVVAAQAADPFTLQNRWTGAFLQEQGQSVGLAESADAAGTRWRALQAPDNHFYLQSESGNYLHVVNGQLVVGQATMDDIGAHWNARQSEDGTLNISNRRGDNLYLNIENGPPAVSQIQPGWWSAMWRMQNAPQPDPNAQASQNSGNENPQRDADASNPDVNAPTQYVFWSEAQRGYLQVGANSALTFANDPTEAGTNWMLEDGPGGFYNLRSEQGTLLYIANGRVGAGYGETTNPAVQWIFDALGDSKYLFSTSAAL